MRDLDKYQKDYLNQPYEKHHKQFRREWVINRLSEYGIETSDILEIGCGTDSLFNSISAFKSFDVVEPGGLFYDKALDDRKRHRLAKCVSIFNCRLEDLLGVNGEKKYDIIVVSALLHEISEQEIFLNEIARFAKRTTIIHFDVPNAFSFHRLLALEMGLISSVHAKSESQVSFQQNSTFDVAALRSILVRNGYEVLDIGTFIFKPFTHQQMQWLVDSSFFDRGLLDALVRMEKYCSDHGSEIYAICTTGR